MAIENDIIYTIEKDNLKAFVRLGTDRNILWVSDGIDCKYVVHNMYCSSSTLYFGITPEDPLLIGLGTIDIKTGEVLSLQFIEQNLFKKLSFPQLLRLDQTEDVISTVSAFIDFGDNEWEYL